MNTTIRFIRRQFSEMSKDGVQVVTRKVKMLLQLFPAVLLVTLIRAIRPLLLVRFGNTHSDRFGHFAANMEMYLCQRKSCLQNKSSLDIFYHSRYICNYQLKKMWERTPGLHICPYSDFVSLLDKINRLLPGFEKHVISTTDRDLWGLLERIDKHLHFTAEEEDFAKRALSGMGIPEEAPFICFHARDSAYLNSAYPNQKWDYHNHRNSRIHNYLQAAEELTRRGYFMIRIGSVVKEPLNTTNPMIIDYPLNFRSDFLDVYLIAKCHFFISCCTGVDAISMVFRRPVAFANIIPIEYFGFWSNYNIFIPKKLWLREEKRFMSFPEILDSGVGMFIRSQQYEESGIDVIENTPEEITSLVIEMDDRLKGRWQIVQEDEILQEQFISLLRPSKFNRVFKACIGRDFLRQNRNLLNKDNQASDGQKESKCLITK